MKLDDQTISELNEIDRSYEMDLSTYNLTEDSSIEDMLNSKCCLATKSNFCLNKLIKQIPNGEVRPQQKLLITRIADLVETGNDGLMQAGTGVGKSISYLIPLVINSYIHKKKCFISTSTKQLTTQLTEKDLPLLREYLFPDLEFAGLQSLSNYICPKKLQELVDEYNNDASIFQKIRSEDYKMIHKIVPVQQDYMQGKISAEDYTIERIGCNCDSVQCAGSSCVRNCKFKGKDKCPVYKIVSKVYRSSVVVTNHALVSRMIVSASKEEDKELGILKGRNIWICDEAHDLETYLEKAFSTELNQYTLQKVYGGKLQKYLESGNMAATFKNKFAVYDKYIRENNDSLDGELRYFDTEELHDDVKYILQVIGGISNIMNKYKYEAQEHLELLNDGKQGYQIDNIENAFNFTSNQMEDLRMYLEGLMSVRARLETLSSIEVQYVPTTKNILNEIVESLRVFNLAYADRDSYITFYKYHEPKGDSEAMFTMSAVYLKAGEALQAGLGMLDTEKSDLHTVNNNKINMIGVSATLKIGDSFKDMADRLGLTKLKDIRCICDDVGTVFDYKKQGLLYIPQNIPDVKRKRKEHFEYFKSSIKDLIEATNGGALILCTTKDETTKTYQYLSYEFQGRFNVLSADDPKWKSKNELVQAFREDENSILVGTRGFFQGLDVQGTSLRLLCLNKLPFGNNDVVSARKQEIAEAKGLNGFRTIAVVPTAMLLMQAVGRLLRHTTDKGVVALYDNRLYEGHSWMNPIVKSVPPFPNTSSLEEVKKFLRE